MQFYVNVWIICFLFFVLCWDILNSTMDPIARIDNQSLSQGGINSPEQISSPMYETCALFYLHLNWVFISNTQHIILPTCSCPAWSTCLPKKYKDFTQSDSLIQQISQLDDNEINIPLDNKVSFFSALLSIAATDTILCLLHNNDAFNPQSAVDAKFVPLLNWMAVSDSWEAGIA